MQARDALMSAPPMPAHVDDTWTRLRRARLHAYRTCTAMHWSYKAGLAAAFTGLIALAAQVAVPLPWTPVPFTFQVLAVMVAGSVLGRRYAFLSLALYILAGAVGLHVFAPSSNAFNPPELWSPDRWRVLVPDAAAKTGFTAGYIFGFLAAATFIGWYVERRRRLLVGRPLQAVLTGLGLLAVAVLGALTWLSFDGNAFSSYTTTQSLLWLFAGLSVLAAATVAVLGLRHRGLGSEKANLFLAMMAAVALIHVPGVVVLKTVLGWSWPQAAALGSAVFLPFDIVKAGAATALTLAFLPTRDDEQHFLATPRAPPGGAPGA